ncbi:50S ribosomal protein L17 [Mucilaginibacter ginsenosidivorans]|uniref:Large ribosomal subunit protein bL17 n=1 Tax=Mucilaginibacter ginsenosidivorans TaxID=398053 RepID=A0A5B8V2C2_9SPHI|nr:50S ribosomal protein L17 [Mucilaginibacter ginsenosidivorans]QEC65338.1 50S ribosomal protein L17 [Mucilaginibacter ginsenosidivorans]
MRHGKKVNHLGRTDSHRKAMLANMASSLIQHKRITTTLAKAKALRVYVEPILTKAKSDTTHSRRTVFSYLQDKDSVSILFRDIAEKIANRPGGYTRIIKMENRLGDNAEMAMIELVDYNTVYTKDGAAVAKKSTRRRGGSGKGGAKAAAPKAEAPAVEEAVVVEEPEAEAPVVEAAAEVEEAPAAETPSAEEAADNEEQAEKGE